MHFGFAVFAADDFVLFLRSMFFKPKQAAVMHCCNSSNEVSLGLGHQQQSAQQICVRSKLHTKRSFRVKVKNKEVTNEATFESCD